MKSPAFQLYAGDFFVDTITWDLDELGLYTRLLFIEWTNGPLPSDPKRLAKIAGTSLKKFNYLFEMVSPKFIQNGEGFLINERLEETRNAQQQFIENQREKGKKRASERWDGHIATATKRLQPEGKPEHSSSSSSSSSSSKKIFIIPNIEDIAAYCRERKNTIDHDKFLNYYQSNGWMVGKNKMKDWKAAIRTWEGNSDGRRQGNSGRGSGAQVDDWQGSGELSEADRQRNITRARELTDKIGKSGVY